MCLAVPMKLVKIDGDDGIVEAEGSSRKVNISFLKSPKAGDYVLIHAGFAIEVVKDKEAKETLKILKDIK